ncbi:hypothetical protein N431DRAFT_325760 [Stipitochalara longipes BDJ]|nr:hypothetical protein N431DRAFT_325760 [Stipitochalara longipes BDJ]
MEFRGPKRSLPPDGKETKAAAPLLAKPVFSTPFWIPGVGFRATIIDFWETGNQERLLLKKPRIEEILYHKAVLDGIMTPPGKAEQKENKLRWIHLPTNNMTWAEMLITGICQDKKMPAYKSLWGTDPFYTSPDLSPHARFIAPQCGRLVRGMIRHDHAQNTDLEPNPLFLAMPYIHWESHLARIKLSKVISEVKEEAIKTSRTQKSKTPLWPDEKGGNDTAAAPPPNDTEGEVHTKKTQTKDLTLETPENEEDYRELLRRYLYKRRPVHLRRTLDQYYYSYLADTNDRDGDQVVMRQFNEEKKSLNLEADSKYQQLLEEKKMDTETSTSPPKPTTWEQLANKVIAPWKRKELKEVDSKLHKIDQVLYYDDNSPVLMIDQLWLWIIDKETIVTCFPHRQYDRNSQDLDATDKTDVLKTIVSYLHSSRRPEINTSHALAELIISQCVGILHKADMIPDLDFLKKYSVQSNKWADQVMRMLSKFVAEFENFMIWIKEQPAESEESIRWFESIFSVTEQTQLLRNIQDIKDELGMLKAVFDDQIQVLTSASEHIEQADFQCMHGCTMEVAALQTSLKCKHSNKTFVDQSSKHLKHVERMQVQANQAYDTLKDLLNLKQQQAYVLEARVSRNEAISSGEQSKTIMVFTIVTIIFLPLTFVTTVFTLPIAEFHREVLPAGSDFPPTPFLRKAYIVKYILIVTFLVAAPLILAAFEIQSLQNGWKKLRLKIAERSKAKKLRGVKREDDGMPEFLKRGKIKRA